jgi:hypothetical protein
MAEFVDALERFTSLLDGDRSENAADLLELKRQCKAVIHSRILAQYVQQSGSTIGCFVILPPEMIYLIIAQLSHTELLKFAISCKYMYKTCWEGAHEKLSARLYFYIKPKQLEKLEDKSHNWFYLAHRVVDPKKYDVPLITPCTFGDYTGDFVDGQRSGFGILDDGERRYVGRFLYGEPHGLGSAVYRDEEGHQTESYTGEYKYGKKHGNGRNETDEYIEEGRFVADFHVSGSWFDKASKGKYFGDCGQLGRVKCTYKDGSICTGYATTGHMHGECTITASDWTAEALMCEDDIVAAEYKLANGDHFLKFGKYEMPLNGHHRYTYADGSVDVGVWKKGKKSGTFFHYDRKGKRTVQKWKKGHLME